MMLFELHLETRRFSGNQKCSDIEKVNDETTTLLNILLSIHDFDAIHAINQSNNLKCQGAVYAHNEN